MSVSSEAYKAYLNRRYSEGSRMASSCLYVIERLGKILNQEPSYSYVPDDFTKIRNLELLNQIYEYVKNEQKNNGGIFNGSTLSKGYWEKNFCSAAIKNYMDFLIETYDGTTSGGGVAPLRDHESLQKITYGAPGTGKSHKIDKCTNEKNSIRVTFHPDTDYAAFVGAYKPTMVGPRKQVILDYENLVDKFKEYLSVQPTNVTRACALFGYDYHDSIRDMTDRGHTIPELVSDAYKSGSTYDSVVRAGMSVYEQSPSETESISYSFVPQAFMKAYVEAWRRYTDTGLQDEEKTYYLVIEEINRGNCAQIFGDLFQLLDRADNGFSAYAIAPDDDIQKFLEKDAEYKLADIPLIEDIKKTTEDGSEKVIATAEDVKIGKKLVLPPNLYIWATMNTSDQSLFPIDSAFKRRWEWEYVPIEDAGMGWKIDVDGVKYIWWSFLEKINDVIATETSSEDKQLGYFFVKAKDKLIDAKTFVSKVIFYLWGDVFKDNLPEGEAFQYTFKKDGKDDKRPIRFADFYHPETGNTKDQWRDKLLKSFLDALAVAKDASAPNASGTPDASGQGSANADGGVAEAGE